MPDPISATIGAVAGIGSGIANIFGAQSAASAIKDATAQANQTILQQQQQGLTAQKNYFDQGNAPLSTIANKGVGDYSNLEAAIPSLTAPIVMDQKTLEQTPGYQFNLTQGLRGIDLSSAASGLSGAQLKAAAKYATGLADSTYQNQFNNANTNKQNAFNFLLGTAQLGTGAAGQYSANATAAGNADVSNSATVGGQLGGNLVTGGLAQGQADVATGKQAGNIFGAATSLFPSSNPFGNYGMYGATNDPTKAGSLY